MAETLNELSYPHSKRNRYGMKNEPKLWATRGLGIGVALGDIGVTKVLVLLLGRLNLVVHHLGSGSDRADVADHVAVVATTCIVGRSERGNRCEGQGHDSVNYVPMLSPSLTSDLPGTFGLIHNGLYFDEVDTA